MSITRKAQIIETISWEKLFEALELFKKVKTVSGELDLYDSRRCFVRKETVDKEVIFYDFPETIFTFTEEDITDLLENKEICISEDGEDFECLVLEVNNYGDAQSKEIDFDLFKFSKINNVLQELSVPKVDTVFKLKLYQE